MNRIARRLSRLEGQRGTVRDLSDQDLDRAIHLLLAPAAGYTLSDEETAELAAIQQKYRCETSTLTEEQLNGRLLAPANRHALRAQHLTAIQHLTVIVTGCSKVRELPCWPVPVHLNRSMAHSRRSERRRQRTACPICTTTALGRTHEAVRRRTGIRASEGSADLALD